MCGLPETWRKASDCRRKEPGGHGKELYKIWGLFEGRRHLQDLMSRGTGIMQKEKPNCMAAWLTTSIWKFRLDISSPFQGHFCGLDSKCCIVGSHGALQKAKENVETFYPLVGIVEQMSDTMNMLEYVYPKFFRGLGKFYKQKLKSMMLSLRALITIRIFIIFS